MKAIGCALVLNILFWSCAPGGASGSAEADYRLAKKKDAAQFPWRKQNEDFYRKNLTALQFKVCRQAGTERPFTGALLKPHGKGIYSCSVCGQPLFRSEAKFDSGTGWPSFFEPISKTAVREISDDSWGMHRVEIRCSRCDSHLGHVFDDGPRPTGLRYCMNSVCLMFDH